MVKTILCENQDDLCHLHASNSLLGTQRIRIDADVLYPQMKQVEQIVFFKHRFHLLNL